MSTSTSSLIADVACINSKVVATDVGEAQSTCLTSILSIKMSRYRTWHIHWSRCCPGEC